MGEIILVEFFKTFKPLAAKVKETLTDKKKSINIFKLGKKSTEFD